MTGMSKELIFVLLVTGLLGTTVVTFYVLAWLEDVRRGCSIAVSRE